MSTAHITERAEFLVKRAGVFKRTMGHLKDFAARNTRSGRMRGEADQATERFRAMYESMSGRPPSAEEMSGAAAESARSFHQKSMERPFTDSAARMAPFAAAAGAFPAGQAIHDRIRLHQSRQKMLEIYPELAQADPAAVDGAFDVISTYAPTLAKSPMTAGAAVRKFLEFDAVDPHQVSQLVGIEEKSRNLARTSPLNTIPQRIMEAGAAS